MARSALSGVRVEWRSHVEVNDRYLARVLPALILAHIRRRTRAGRDTQDLPFRPYARSYAARLAKRGESTRVDLDRTGALLRGLVVTVRHTRRGLEIDVRPSGRDASRARALDARRPWLGVSPSGLRSLAARVRRRTLRSVPGKPRRRSR